MNRDIIARKAPYEPIELSFDEKLDAILERRWSFGTAVAVFFASLVGVVILILVGNVVLGLN